MIHRIRRILLLVGIGSLSVGALPAQVGTPDDYDFLLEAKDKILVHEGDEFSFDAVLKTRVAGVFGWSYGVQHDTDVLEVLSPTTTGTDVPGAMKDGQQETRIINVGGTNVGWFQFVILAFMEDGGQLPTEDHFVMAKAKYKVRNGVLGAQKDLTTSIAFTDKLSSNGGSNTIDVIVVLEGAKGVIPKVQIPVEATIQAFTPELNLVAANPAGRKLIADKNDFLDLEVRLENDSTNGADVQGWSYGVKLDPAVLDLVKVSSGPEVAVLNGGKGPDFRTYVCPTCPNPPCQPCDDPPVPGPSKDGDFKGITVAVAVSAFGQSTGVLPVPGKGMRVLEILRVKSKNLLSPPAQDVNTQIDFVSELLPKDEPRFETVITVDNRSVTPTQDPPLTVTLTAQLTKNRFKRGYANPDSKFDIADGIWTILWLYFNQGGKYNLYCQDAADSNDDGRVDISDAIFTFNYLLQPGKRSGDPLYLKPPPPYPGCGDDPLGVHNPVLPCDQPTPGCQ